MKTKFIFLVLAYIGIATPVLGQTMSSFEIGIQEITGASWMYGNTLLSRTNKPILSLGLSLYFQYNTNGPFSVRIEPGFEGKGSQSEWVMLDQNGNEVGRQTTKERLGYFTLPVLGRVSFGDEKVQFFLNGGPYIGYLPRGREFSGNPNLPPSTWLYKELDFGATVGAGISVPLTPVFIFSAEARNSLGLYNISSNPVIGNASIKNNVSSLVLAIGYRFGNGD